jgi:hypothetical protein
MAFRSGAISTRGVRAAARPGRSARLVVQARAPEAGVGIFGTKAGMMSYFTAEGLCIPATVVALEGGNVVTQIKTTDTDGYNAVQVGYRVVPERKVKKPELGHLKKAGAPPMKHLREFRVRPAPRRGPDAAPAAPRADNCAAAASRLAAAQGAQRGRRLPARPGAGHRRDVPGGAAGRRGGRVHRQGLPG